MKIRVVDFSGRTLADYTVPEKFRARVEIRNSEGHIFVFQDNDSYEAFGWFTSTSRARRREGRARKKYQAAYAKEQAAKAEKAKASEEES